MKRMLAFILAMRSRNAVPMFIWKRPGSAEPSTSIPNAFGSAPLRSGSSAIERVLAPPCGSQEDAWKSAFGPQ